VISPSSNTTTTVFLSVQLMPLALCHPTPNQESKCLSPTHQSGDVGLLNRHGPRPQRPNLHLRTNTLQSHSHITPPRPRGRDQDTNSSHQSHSASCSGMRSRHRSSLDRALSPLCPTARYVAHRPPLTPGPTQDVTDVLVEAVKPHELKQDQTKTSIISAITSGQQARSNPAG
jgi:hypothetical protein